VLSRISDVFTSIFRKKRSAPPSPSGGNPQLVEKLEAMRGDNVSHGSPKQSDRSLGLTERANIIGIVNTRSEGSVLEE